MCNARIWAQRRRCLEIRPGSAAESTPEQHNRREQGAIKNIHLPGCKEVCIRPLNSQDMGILKMISLIKPWKKTKKVSNKNAKEGGHLHVLKSCLKTIYSNLIFISSKWPWSCDFSFFFLLQLACFNLIYTAWQTGWMKESVRERQKRGVTWPHVF